MHAQWAPRIPQARKDPEAWTPRHSYLLSTGPRRRAAERCRAARPRAGRPTPAPQRQRIQDCKDAPERRACASAPSSFTACSANARSRSNSMSSTGTG